ncbi:MAG: glucosylceramidase [Flavobacterium sp.]|uniref:glycoside hydrolase family 30 protein n=1 Tax=Flavobacterium sp. TaxID=239 RepID=UPI0011FBEEF1|nr:glycoside hydrolase family 30 beta sandwich domain-containing protein [Flavobacterium sp.]RZJ65920.1 MAG: glucosylceramidase [Flavobacterium sp.]
MKKLLSTFGLAALLACQIGCSNSDGDGNGDTTPDPDPVEPGVNEVDFWLTKSDQSVKLIKQTTILDFTTTPNNNQNIDVTEGETYQTVDGFGYALTGGSVTVINQLTAAKKQELLQDLFGASGIGVSYLRISIGASDMSASPYTYDDMPSGQTDPTLANFSISSDDALVNLLTEILAINPNIKIVATPWSAPTWMKDNNSFVGGSLLPANYGVYSQYFVNYLQAMQAEGINITAITPQNEPLHGGNNPSMVMTADQQNDFIKNHLGPAFQSAGLNTKIIVYDHNLDNTAYPLSILNDAATRPFVDGSAFHLYAGNINSMLSVHAAYPDKNLYFTEQFTSSTGDFGGDLKWHLKNVIIGSMRNWSKNALEWNLATNISYGPHTENGCTTCQGAITVNNGNTYTKNVSYYIIAHAAKFVPAGSVRIGSTNSGNINTVAFKRPDGKKVLIAENDGTSASTVNIRHNNQWVPVFLDAGSVATFVW